MTDVLHAAVNVTDPAELVALKARAAASIEWEVISKISSPSRRLLARLALRDALRSARLAVTSDAGILPRLGAGAGIVFVDNDGFVPPEFTHDLFVGGYVSPAWRLSLLPAPYTCRYQDLAAGFDVGFEHPELFDAQFAAATHLVSCAAMGRDSVDIVDDVILRPEYGAASKVYRAPAGVRVSILGGSLGHGELVRV